MNIDFYLPTPTENELNLGAKVEYYERLIPLDLAKKYKITQEELYGWIHHNYSSYFLTDQELSYKSYKKLKI